MKITSCSQSNGDCSIEAFTVYIMIQIINRFKSRHTAKVMILDGDSVCFMSYVPTR